jgi:hypothetical protein
MPRKLKLTAHFKSEYDMTGSKRRRLPWQTSESPDDNKENRPPKNIKVQSTLTDVSQPVVTSPRNSQHAVKPTVVTWLNSLSDSEAEGLHHIVNIPKMTRNYFLSPAVVTRLQGCTNLEHPQHDGTYYLDWVQCNISTIAPNKNGNGEQGHPRVKITVPKKSATMNDIYRQLMRLVSPDKMRTFDGLITGSGYQNQVRIGVHVA